MEDYLFNLKMAAKQMTRSSKKCEKDETSEKVKLKKAIFQKNMEGAKICAENAIRQKNQKHNFLRLSERVDAIASRVQSAMQMRQVTESMTSVAKNMVAALRSMNLEKLAIVMEHFEKSFEDLDIQAESLEGAMKGATYQLTLEDEVKQLIEQTADENGLEINLEMPDAASTSLGTSVASIEQEELSQRLTHLRET